MGGGTGGDGVCIVRKNTRASIEDVRVWGGGGGMTELDDKSYKEPTYGRKKNIIFTASASVSEQKEHFMLSSSSPSLIPHLQKTLQAGGPRRGEGVNVSRFLSQR